MRTIVLFFTLIAALMVSPISSSAITIDEFNGEQYSVSPGVTFSASSSPQCIGSIRKIFAENYNPNLPGRVFSQVVLGQLYHSQDVLVEGASVLVWDGTSQPQTDASGLGGIDFLQDGGNSLQLTVTNLDLSSTLTIIIFDARDTSGASYSFAHIPISGPINSQTGPRNIVIPYASLTNPGPNGPANFAFVGAVFLQIDGEPNTDMSTDYFGTNGLCRYVPDANGRVIDQCGVCGGDNSSCTDCAGVVNGSAQTDRCGICNGDGLSCLGCNIIDLTPILGRMDSGAKLQEHAIRSVLKQVDSSTHDDKIHARTARIRTTVHQLQIRNWTISWQIPRFLRQCTNEIFCTSVSTNPKTSEYRTHSEQLRKNMTTAVKLIRKVRKKGPSYYQHYIVLAARQHAQNMVQLESVPTADMSCN
jgi:hypothetical protein